MFTTTTTNRRSEALHRNARILCLAALAVLPATARMATAGTQATFVTRAASVSNAGAGATYDSATVALYIDPAQTNWIAWNDQPRLEGYGQYPGESLLWAGRGYGCADSIMLTITSPTGTSLQYEIDRSDANGVLNGYQQVLFGNPAAAPDIIRLDRQGNLRRQNEGGAFNQLFTTAGTYQLNFSFINRWGCTASHPETWLLVDTIQTCTPAVQTTVLVGGTAAPVVCSPPPVICSPPPVVCAPPVVVHRPAPRVIYSPPAVACSPPVVIHRPAPRVVYRPAPRVVYTSPVVHTTPVACAPRHDPAGDIIRTIFNVSEIARDRRHHRRWGRGFGHGRH